MHPTLLTLPRLTLAGFSFYGDPFETGAVWTEENQIGRLCSRLMAFLEQHPLPASEPDALYEVHVYSAETLEKGFFEVFVGLPVADPAAVPLELVVKSLPPGDYAVFTMHGEQIASDWYFSVDQWLAEAGYTRSQPYTFQRYDQRFKGMDRLAESAIDLYMPVKKIAVQP